MARDASNVVANALAAHLELGMPRTVEGWKFEGYGTGSTACVITEPDGTSYRVVAMPIVTHETCERMGICVCDS